MVWQVNYPNLPFPTQGQMNPYHQALQTGLEDYVNINKAAYAPLTSQADIASKAAYATYSPYSYLAKALSDPLTLAALQKSGQLSNVMNKLASIPTDPYAGLRNTQGATGAARLWDNLTSSLGAGSQPTIQAPQPVSVPQEQPASDDSNQVYGASNKASDQFVDQAGRKAEASLDQNAAPTQQPTSQQANKGFFPEIGDMVTAKVAQMFPLSPLGMQKKAESAYQTESATSEADLWKDRIKENSGALQNYDKANASISSMKALYPKLHWAETGWLGGQGPAISSAAQSFDNFAKNYSTANVRALQSGHITNTDFAIGDRLKPSRMMQEDAFNGAAEYSEALVQRAKQKQKFDTEARAKKIPVDQADVIWSDFMQSHPMYDSNTLTLNRKNVAMKPNDIFKSYLDNNKSASSIPNAKVKGDQGYISYKQGQNSVPITMPDGRRWNVPLDKVSEAIRRGGRQVGA